MTFTRLFGALKLTWWPFDGQIKREYVLEFARNIAPLNFVRVLSDREREGSG